MKAAVLKSTENIKVIDWPQPEPADHEVVVQVKACGICGTDQHIYHGMPGSAQVDPPIVLGHELAGIVAETGENVTILKRGDRVSIDPNIYCGHCEFCRSGKRQLCGNLQAIGVTQDGGMGEYCAVPADNCYLLPEELSYEEGALAEPLGCVLHGFHKLTFSPLHSVMIVGGGFIGQLFMQLIKKTTPASLYVIEPDTEKWDLLYELGADCVVGTGQAEMKDLENRFDAVIECVGRKDSMSFALSAARKGGQILLFGVAAPETAVPVFPFHIFSKELTIKGSLINPFTQNEAIALLARNTVNVKPLISHLIQINQVPELMAKHSSMNLSKAIVQWS